MRWSLALQPYHFTIRYIRGEENFCAEYLSRGCAADTEQTFCQAHFVTDMLFNNFNGQCLSDVIVYVQLNYPSMCITNYSI